MISTFLAGLILQMTFVNESFAEKKDTRRVLQKDEINQDDLAAQYTEAAHQENLKAINQYEDLLRTMDIEGDQKAELMFRLAEKYFEEGRYEYNIEQQVYHKQYDDCFNTPGCDLSTIKEDTTNSEKWQKKAIRLYTTILDTHPQYARADEVLFFLGSAYHEIKDPDKAVRQFVRLTQQYNTSRYIADAYVNIGEYYFDQNNAFKALQAYKRATTYQDSPQYGFALYKLAWCYYNVQEYGDAIEHMKQVVSYSSASTGEGGEQKRITLQEEALKDLVRFFADAGEMDEAEAYFNKLGREELVMKMLKRLAGMYFDQGKFDQSVKTYRRLISKDPNSKEAPIYQNEIINSMKRMGKKQEAINEVNRLLQDYRKESSWARNNSSDPEVLKKASEYIEIALYNVAKDYHEEAIKLKTGRQAEETFKLAESAYRTYITELPDGKNVYVMKNNFAEILYDLKNFAEAYEQYMGVVKMDPKGNLSIACASSAILSANEMIEQEKREGKIKSRKSNTDIEPIELSEWETKKMQALDNFGTTYPTHKDSIEYLTESADLLFEKNRLDEASERFRQVIALNPKSKQAERAAIQITEALTFRANAKSETKEYELAIKDFGALKDTSKAFLDQQGLGSQKFKKDMAEYYQIASGELIRVTFEGSQKTDSDKRTAADGYREYAANFPKAENAPAAINNAAFYYNDIKDVVKTMETRHLLIDTYPDSKYFTTHLAELGFAYETIADFRTAAEWYEKLLVKDPEYSASKDALHRAAIFRERLGDWEQAIADNNLYITTYPDDERTIGKEIDNAKIYQKFGQDDAARKAYTTFHTKPPEGASLEMIFFARMQEGEIIRKTENKFKLDKHWSTVLGQFNKLKPEEISPLL